MCVYSEPTGNSLSFYNQEEAEIIKSVFILLKMYGNEELLEAFGEKKHTEKDCFSTWLPHRAHTWFSLRGQNMFSILV